MNADQLADNFRETHGLSDEAVPALSAMLRTYAASRLLQLFSVRNADRKRWSDADWKNELAAMMDKEASDAAR